MQMMLLNYIEKNINKLIVCRYDIPSSGGAVMRAFDFANLNHLSEYSLSVGYTLKSGKSYKNKDNRMFTTCFGRPEPPRNIRYTISKDCSITVEWLAPQISNSPYVCYYEVKYNDGINPSVTTNIDTTSFKFSGKAKGIFSDVLIYDGEWKDGNFNGKGTLNYLEDGSYYDGDFKNG